MPDLHYEHPKLAEIYDLDSGWSIDRDFYLSLPGTARKSILDLGCGTGLICDAYAEKGHEVTGVDPAEAMLDVARRKPHGKNIEWVQSFAQGYQSDKRFDLIIMTGHAFQVLLEDDDVLRVFDVARQHLKPDGRFVFESRNPNIDWKLRWGACPPYTLAGTDISAAWRFIDAQHDRMTFEQHYGFSDETLISRSTLRFLTCSGIEERLAKSGFRIDTILGDWDGKPFDETSSDEMIFVVKTA